MPLTKVLRDAHSLLDDVAKERCGRDSLAVRVWKPGGQALEWAMPWEYACEDTPDGKRLVLNRLCESLQGDDPNNQFSNGFFYKIRERLELLNPADGASKSIFDTTDDDEPAVKLMAAEYVTSGLFSNTDKTAQQKLDHAIAVVRPLLKQCYPMRRILPERDKSTGKQPEATFVSPQQSYHADAALLVRFLVHKGVL